MERPATTSDATSCSLLGRARENDPDAWRRLVNLYTPLVFHWCRECGLDAHDASDILQETFQSVHRALGKFERARQGAFRGWLWTITRNNIRMQVRQRVPDAVGGSTAAQRWQNLPEDEPLPGDDSVSGERANSLLHRALEIVRGDFSESTWKAFQAVVVQQRPAAEAAKELNLSLGAVYQARARVLHRLREELGDLLDGFA